MEIDLIIKHIILGSLQGIFEWLPVSSEGIVSLTLINVFREPFSKSVTLALWLHLGTLLAVTVYFWRDLRELVSHIPEFFKHATERKNEKGKLIFFLFVTTLITGLVGAMILQFAFESDLFGLRATFLIGFFLIITGLLQRRARRSASFKTVGDLNMSDAILLGLLQGLAVLPGLSRSGLTVSAFLFRGYDDRDALRISFLMSIPAVAGLAFLLGLKERELIFDQYVFIALFFSFLFGIISIKLLMRLAEKLPLWKFAIFLGGITVLFSLVVL